MKQNKDPLIGLKIRFPKGNKFRFSMDFGFYENIPTDVEFKIIESDLHDRYTLVAKGYGLKGHYGNGSLFVDKEVIINVLAKSYKKCLH